jgi:hypothetical protein
MRTYKAGTELSHWSLRNYRSRLRQLWLKLPSLIGPERAKALETIKVLEQQVGVRACDIPRPGRPRGTK